ncbi:MULTISPECIES: hypothetical protein [Actinoplanes]|uniref:glycosyltransferase family 2 protein n=1 Tax=Actinoplanes TaxID=1865 RepID=UPI000AA578BC|nr:MULTISPECIES: hypothetical protein [Actinoplanes]GLY02588.1 hypothetical protein Acsp01_29670 [Actinoplanes sp. NBRC 101535]
MSSASHHRSHRGLIQRSASGPERATVDAVIVPSVRSPLILDEAGRIAGELGCALLVLCSMGSYAARVVEHLAGRPSLRVVAVDFPPDGVSRLPVLETSTVLGRSRLQRRADTSAKRNLGLALARTAGWRNVVFLDDDIIIPDAADLERAAAMLTTHDVVGLRVGGFPDNSVVCHANRETGAEQDTFIGGGALVVPAHRTESFFPEIYNEDWFFLLGDTALRRVGQVGVAVQKPYDPFADPDRARGEEFGDVLAEGVFARLDDGLPIGADDAYWAEFLADRLHLIRTIEARIPAPPVTERDSQMVEALSAAKGRLQYIQPKDCVRYIEAWQRDRATWRSFVTRIRRIHRPDAGLANVITAIGRFGLTAVTGPPPGPHWPGPEREVRQPEPAAAG